MEEFRKLVVTQFNTIAVLLREACKPDELLVYINEFMVEAATFKRVEPEEDPDVWVIDANIGSGKTSLVESIKNDPELSAIVEVAHEPVHMWADILPAFYSDPQKYGLALQMTVEYAHTLNQQQALARCRKNGKKILLMERDPRSCLIFCRANGFPPQDLAIIENLSKMMSTKGDYRVPAVSTRILLDLPPKVCYERIKERHRNGEELISLEYLQKLGAEHEKAFNGYIEENARVMIFRLTGEETKEQMHSFVKFFILQQIKQ